MSEINEFARGLVKRQIQIYKENKSKEFDMTQPLSVLICCSIIIFSDYKQMHSRDSLIKEISENDKEKKIITLLKIIITEETFNTIMENYSRGREISKPALPAFINENYKELEVIFSKLRNNFAHIIDGNKTKILPLNENNEFKSIQVEILEKITITKDHIIQLIELIDDFISKEQESS